MCGMHYQRFRTTGDPGPAAPKRRANGTAPKWCAVDGCANGGRTKNGLCEMHYQRSRTVGEIGPAGRKTMQGGSTGVCTIEGCDKPAWNKGICQMHARRLRLTGELGAAESTRPNFTTRDPNSVRRANELGYVEIKVRGHVEAKKNGWALEHRVVMSDHIGRRLTKEENVHHLNGVRDDNRLENLELWTKSQPWGQRVSDKLAWARQIIDLYSTAPEDVRSGHSAVPTE